MRKKPKNNPLLSLDHLVTFFLKNYPQFNSPFDFYEQLEYNNPLHKHEIYHLSRIIMKTSTTSNFFKTIYLLCSISAFFFATATKAVAHPVILDAQSDYDSDSEDEEDYEYPGIKPLEIPEKTDQYCLSLFRGIHFSPSIFNNFDNHIITTTFFEKYNSPFAIR